MSGNLMGESMRKERLDPARGNWHVMRSSFSALAVVALLVAFAVPASLPGVSASAAGADPAAGGGNESAEGVAHVELLIGNKLPSEGGPPSPPPSPLKAPFGIDFDPQGRMWIVELEGGRVHTWSPREGLHHVGGDGSKSYRGDGGPLKNATFNGMHNVAVTPAGDVLIADSWNHCVRRVDAETGVVSTFAGTGKPGFAGDGGPATAAQFNFLMCITLTPRGDRLHIADLKNLRIREIDLRTGTVRTIAGNGRKGVPQDGAVAVDAPLVDPRAVAADAHGRVYILERGGHALRVVDADGRIRTVAGTGRRGFRDGPAREAQFGSPKHICVDERDRVWIADDLNAAIRLYDPGSNTVRTVVGRGHGKPAFELSHPHGVCRQAGRLYIVDTRHDRILRATFSRAE